MFLVLKLLVFYVWCCDGMRLGVQVMSACLVDESVAGRVAIVLYHSTIATQCNTNEIFNRISFYTLQLVRSSSIMHVPGNTQ